MKRSKRDLRRSSGEWYVLQKTPASNAKTFDLRKNTPVTLEVLIQQRGWGVFLARTFYKTSTTASQHQAII